MDKAVDAVISVRVPHAQQIQRNRDTMILPHELYRVCVSDEIDGRYVNTVCPMSHTLPEANMWVKKNLEYEMLRVISLKC